MQQQIFQIAKPIKETTSNDQEKDQIDLFIGVKSPLNDPFNVFFRLRDINDPSSTLIYFYIYSMGKSKAIIWGVYNVLDNTFLIDASCKYDLAQLNEALRSWKTNDYVVVSSEVRNRSVSRIAQYIIFEDNRQKFVNLYDNFKLYFMYNMVRRGQLKIDDIINNKELLAFIQKFEEEEILFGRDFDLEYKKIVDPIVGQINKGIIQFLPDKTGVDYLDERVESAFNLLEDYLSDMPNIIALHIFILLMADIEEYRTAKYIIAVQNPNVDSKYKEVMESYLQDSFVNAWLDRLVELSSGFAISETFDSVAMKVELAEEIVRILEKELNVSQIGIIGGPKFEAKLSARIRRISDQLKRFLETSIYSKQSFVAELDNCYLPTDCPFNDCGLYEHGARIQSAFDFT